MRKLDVRLLVLALAIPANALAADAAAVKTPAKTVARATVNGEARSFSHAYLFHAPDNWNEKQQNSVVIVTPAAIDAKRFDSAKTLQGALDGLGEHLKLEIRPDRQLDISICHDGFGKGMCYSTTLSATDWKTIALEPKRAAGEGIKPWMGREETVFEKYKLFYEVAFDAPWIKDFATRR